MVGLGTIILAPSIISSCKKDDEETGPGAVECMQSPIQDVGPFFIKSPSELVKANIVGDRKGIPLVMNYTILDSSNDCAPLSGVYVDLWQADARGNYSEYSGQVDGDFTGQQFLRGRQMTDGNGRVSFISIYPGWYPGRAPHIHLEILDSNEVSLLTTQTAFPEDISREVYDAPDYKGVFDTPNASDGVFRIEADLAHSMPDDISGNLTDGYVLNETIRV